MAHAPLRQARKPKARAPVSLYLVVQRLSSIREATRSRVNVMNGTELSERKGVGVRGSE